MHSASSDLSDVGANRPFAGMAFDEMRRPGTERTLTKFTSPRISFNTSAGVAGLMTTPTGFSRSLIRRIVRYRLQVLSTALGAVYFTDMQLFNLLACRMANLTGQRGVCGASAD